MRRRVALALPLLLVAACKDEPDFETRYEKASNEIEARATAMDADIAAAEKAAVAASDLPDAEAPPNAAASSGE
ncbi:MAG: hypothetical protein ACT6Q5_02630 [Sphingopyxis solisilvae]|uniref:hypothetical protein n=1 Tax=Sphingopyxis solisilvae TaxID=1886788 RepID=UPI0040369EDD